MPEVTLQAIEQLLDKRLKPIDKTLAAHTSALTALSQTLDRVAVHTAILVVDVPEMKTDVKAIRATVDSHTDSIEHLVTKKNIKDNESTIRLARFERALKQVGEHLGLKLEL